MKFKQQIFEKPIEKTIEKPIENHPPNSALEVESEPIVDTDKEFLLHQSDECLSPTPIVETSRPSLPPRQSFTDIVSPTLEPDPKEVPKEFSKTEETSVVLELGDGVVLGEAVW